MVRVTDLDKSYATPQGSLHVLKGVNLHIAPGEHVAIMGASGSGKTTLLHVMGLLDTFDRGQLLLSGEDVGGWNESRLSRFRNQKLGFVFQAANLIPHLDILENAVLPLSYRGMGRAEMLRAGMELLERLGLAGHRHHFPNQLSGGQQQRVAIARAIITHPSILLADEPTGQLDSASTQSVMDLLQHINRDTGATLVVVTHEEAVAKRAHRIVHIRDGRLC